MEAAGVRAHSERTKCERPGILREWRPAPEKRGAGRVFLWQYLNASGVGVQVIFKFPHTCRLNCQELLIPVGEGRKTEAMTGVYVLYSLVIMLT